MLSSAKRKYLFIIYELGQKNDKVRSVDIANTLSIKRASVSNMLPQLIEDNMIERKKDRSIAFTPDGAKVASSLYLKYVAFYEFFTKTLNSSDENARVDSITCLCSLSENNLINMTDYIIEKNNNK